MAEKSIELDSVEIAAAIFGNCDRNIRLLEKEFSVTAVCRGTMLRLSGEEANVAAAVRAVEGMLLLIENHTPLEDQTVRYCLSLAHDGKEQRVRELTEDFVTVTVKGRPIRPKTLGQKEYLNAIRKNAVTFGVGPAGTGKTYLAVAMAVKAFKAKDISRIVLTRPAGYRKKPGNFWLPEAAYHKYPAFVRALRSRYYFYNKTVEWIDRLEQEGKIFVIRPSVALPIGRTEHSVEKLQETYDIGRKDAANQMHAMENWFKSY